MVSGLTAWEKEQKIRDLSAQVIKVRADWQADAARLQADVDSRDQRLAEVAAALRRKPSCKPSGTRALRHCGPWRERSRLPRRRLPPGAVAMSNGPTPARQHWSCSIPPARH